MTVRRIQASTAGKKENPDLSVKPLKMLDRSAY
jgi:hypothetical protein